MSRANQVSSACQFSGEWGARRQEKRKGGFWALVQAPSPSWWKATKSLLSFPWATFKFAIDRLYFSSISLNPSSTMFTWVLQVEKRRKWGVDRDEQECVLLLGSLLLLPYKLSWHPEGWMTCSSHWLWNLAAWQKQLGNLVQNAGPWAPNSFYSPFPNPHLECRCDRGLLCSCCSWKHPSSFFFFF